MESELESKRSVSDKWIDNNVYQALEQVESYERRMRNGCADILEYIQTLRGGIEKIPLIQVQNMKMALTELDILLKNTKEILQDDDYKEAVKELDKINLLFDKGKKEGKKVMMVYNIKVNELAKRRSVSTLTPLFDLLSLRISNLRQKMVSYLSHILYLKNKPVKVKEI